MHNEVDMSGEGQKEIQLDENQRELSQRVFQRARQLIQKFGEDSTWGES